MSENGRRFGSCVEKRPCGFEAACRQLENNYYKCICPQDLSEPTDDLKCLTRKTVPIAPKSFVNLSINKNEHKPLETVVYPFTTTSQPIKTTLNQTTSLPSAKQMDVNILGYILRINTFMLLAVGITAFVSVALIITIIWWSRTSKGCCKSKTAISNSPVVSLIRGVIQEDSYSMNPQYAAPSPVAKDTILIPYLSKSCISSMVEIGQGFFGKVYKGVLQHTDGKYETVAIKVLKDHTNSEAKEDFMREVEIMTYFRHPNILTLIGVCPQEDKCSPWMIFEFMAYGDLTEVLRNSSDQFSHYSEHLPVLDKVLKLIHDGVLLDIPLNCPPVICVMMNGCWKSDPKERLRFIDIHERLKNVTKRPELDSPLPRPPTLPVIVDHLSLRKMPSEELLDVDDYLQPDEQRVAVEYIMPYPA
ncbi:hypothetical protein AGLY_014410 [Aphis glycines]|uniref:Protein kinase domain-containing protein n=1 Tax=Aphis glycines TaxID=307491 RepID=A0A6G0T3F1_APHGL|nr:hypothetical protein AGLY_014410 [Aphis glycines]